MSDSEVARSESRHRFPREPARAISLLPDGPDGSGGPGRSSRPEKPDSSPPTDAPGALFRPDGRRATRCPRGSRIPGPPYGPRRAKTFTRSLLLPRRGPSGDAARVAGTEAPPVRLRTVYWGVSPDALRGPPR
ncbi:hypothetical protein [Streptomyces sp. NPDC052496]|uniref:hypothetical protein n=1 Tax=Streptomyces sp. NPDC052496 TaxID=3154951 RepID=UPI00343D3573